MNAPIASEFLKQWIVSANERDADLLANWNADLGKYTAIIKDETDSVIDKVAERLKLIAYSEHYHTDAILYREEDLVPGAGKGWFRGIKVAFEHEHIYDKRLYQEISHLLILHSGLSVVVTYPPEGERKDSELMHYFHSLIRGSPRYNELDEKENFLLIFGYREPKLEWKGLVYKNAGWKECLPS